ncbi:MAG: hypothetical protein ACI4Q3_00905 [Kiritimatiellia bacterium]
MKNFLKLFTRNWPFKLLALVLALLVFYAVRYADELRPRDPGPSGVAPVYTPASLMKGAVDAIPQR